MERFNIHARTAGFAVCTAMAAALLVSCSAQTPHMSANAPAVSGDELGSQQDQAIAKAEKRVAKSPRNASARVDLAQAYLNAGRFDSAATTFQDAVSLGEDSPRIGLGLALADIGSGRSAQALSVLSRWHDKLPVSDYGLALALAGQPSQAVELLSDAVRGGENTPKTRQNLAYAYALSGRWAEARVIASQDVPADQLDKRLQDWASRGAPAQFQARVASLLGTPVRGDAGQPAALALNAPDKQLGDNAPRMAEADTPLAPAPAPNAELPPITTNKVAEAAYTSSDDAQAVVQPTPAVVPPAKETSFAAAFETRSHAMPQPVNAKFVAQPAVKSVGPTRSAYVDTAAPSTHLVQLGSFKSLDGAKRAWGIFVKRNPALKDHTMRITEAEVNGQRYFRVAAEGFDRSGAYSLCSRVKERGNGCLAYAKTHPLPGALPGKAHGDALLAVR